MDKVLWLLALQGTLGALDTLYFHEWRAHLPTLRTAGPELRLHAARDFIYFVIFATLPWIAWQGRWAGVMVLLLAAEIVITLADFVIEDRTRRPLGGVFSGERVMHAVMGIVYGATLAYFEPVLWAWAQQPSALALYKPDVPDLLRYAMAAMAGGVLISGLRDIWAARRLR